MIEIKIHGSIKNGCFYPRNSKVYIQKLKDAGIVDDCVLTITGSNKRTIDQNSYAWVVCDRIAMAMRENGYSEITASMIYRRIEQNHCGTPVTKGEKTYEFIKPLKEQEPDRFWEIIEDVRIQSMQNLGIQIDTPAQHFGITEEAYDLWRSGAINFLEAKKMTDAKR